MTTPNGAAAMKLGTIEEEAVACRAAWAAKPRAKAGVHIHHECAAELLTEPIEARIAYILTQKPKEEQALRLHLMRPITAPAWADYNRITAPALADYRRIKAAAWADYRRISPAAHLAFCVADCPFDGSTIFPVAK